MIEVYKIEAKNQEEALEKLVTLIGQPAESLFVKESETEGKLFKAKKVVIEAIKKEDVVSFIKDFIKTTSKLMNLEIQSEVNEHDDVISIILVSDNNPILIGKEGRTLNSFQLLIRQAIQAKTGFNVKINLDASNYKVRKMQNLEYDMKRIIHEVLDTHIAVSLDPMNSYERRFVHNLISEYKGLSSESEGEGMYRHIIIKYNETK